MAAQIRCPQCHRFYQVATNVVGQSVQCTACGHSFKAESGAAPPEKLETLTFLEEQSTASPADLIETDVSTPRGFPAGSAPRPKPASRKRGRKRKVTLEDANPMGGRPTPFVIAIFIAGGVMMVLGMGSYRSNVVFVQGIVGILLALGAWKSYYERRDNPQGGWESVENGIGFLAMGLSLLMIVYSTYNVVDLLATAMQKQPLPWPTIIGSFIVPGFALFVWIIVAMYTAWRGFFTASALFYVPVAMITVAAFSTFDLGKNQFDANEFAGVNADPATVAEPAATHKKPQLGGRFQQLALDSNAVVEQLADELALIKDQESSLAHRDKVTQLLAKLEELCALMARESQGMSRQQWQALRTETELRYGELRDATWKRMQTEFVRVFSSPDSKFGYVMATTDWFSKNQQELHESLAVSRRAELAKTKSKLSGPSSGAGYYPQPPIGSNSSWQPGSNDAGAAMAQLEQARSSFDNLSDEDAMLPFELIATYEFMAGTQRRALESLLCQDLICDLGRLRGRVGWCKALGKCKSHISWGVGAEKIGFDDSAPSNLRPVPTDNSLSRPPRDFVNESEMAESLSKLTGEIGNWLSQGLHARVESGAFGDWTNRSISSIERRGITLIDFGTPTYALGDARLDSLDFLMFFRVERKSPSGGQGSTQITVRIYDVARKKQLWESKPLTDSQIASGKAKGKNPAAQLAEEALDYIDKNIDLDTIPNFTTEQATKRVAELTEPNRKTPLDDLVEVRYYQAAHLINAEQAAGAYSKILGEAGGRVMANGSAAARANMLRRLLSHP